MKEDPDQAWLSPLLNRVAAVAGVRAALLLGHEKGCQSIYIPKYVPEGHWLRQLVGNDAAQAIAAEFGGSKLDIPPALVGEKRRRQRAIAKMTGNGYSINRITKALGVSRSTVKNHRARLRDIGDDDSGTLI